jgi:hypothetical protein
MIGKNADISVTSVLQTTAGKMIFGRLSEEPHENGGTNIHNTDTRGINGNNAARRPYRDSRSAPTVAARSSVEHEDPSAH